MPLPNPTNTTPTEPTIRFIKLLSVEKSNRYIESSIVPAITIIFNIVPTPGCCFNGNQNNKTPTLLANIAKPIDQLKLIANPSAKTTHGLSPIAE